MKTAVASQKQVHEEHGQRVEAAAAGFRAIVESCGEVDAPDAEKLQKLNRVEQSWTHWQGEVDVARENNRDARGTVKMAKEALESAIKEARQPQLPGIE